MIERLGKFKWALLALVWIGCFAMIIYVMDREDTSCNKLIFVEGELSRDVNSINYFSSGRMIRVEYCDGSKEDIPTERVIKIIHKDDVQ